MTTTTTSEFLSRNRIDVGSIQHDHLKCGECDVVVNMGDAHATQGSISIISVSLADGQKKLTFSSLDDADGVCSTLVPFGLELHCTSNTACGNKWYVCLSCGSKMSYLHSLQRHILTKKHDEAFTLYCIRSRSNANFLTREMMDQSSDENLIGGDEDYNHDQNCDDKDGDGGGENHTISDFVGGGLCDDWILSVSPSFAGEISLQELQKVFYAGSKAPDFFHYESMHPKQGIKHLMARAFNQKPQEVTDEEAAFQLKVAYLLSCMTEKEQALLADILYHVSNMHREDLTIFKRTRPPTSCRDFREIYLKGKAAILPNLPHPVVLYSPDETHAFVDIVDVLANMLAKATPMEKFDEDAYLEGQTKTYDAGVSDENVTVSSTKAAHDLYLELKEESTSIGEFILYIWMREWSDDFDPSHTKSNRCQVWLKTFTFCPPATCNSDINTAFIAIGSKGDDHESMEKLITAQLQELAKGNGKMMYHGGLNRLIHVKAGIVSTCVDRPERTKLFQLGDHNGTYSVCWGFAAQIDGSRKTNCLPSCPFCRRERIFRYTGREHSEESLDRLMTSTTMMSINSTTSSNSEDHDARDNRADFLSVASNSNSGDDSDSPDTDSDDDTLHESAGSFPPTARNEPHTGICPLGKCASWNLLDPAFSFPAPKKFPMMCDNRDGAPIAPLGREIQPDVPADERRLPAVNITIQWLQQAVRFAYHNYGTHPPGANARARYWRKDNFEAFLRTCAIVKRLQIEIANCIHSGQPCPIPTLWRRSNDSLRRCHYAAMHMLFLGHVKSNFLMMAKWLKKYELFTDFGRQTNLLLKPIQKLRLRRFNAHPLSSSTFGPGSWVSENHLFWARASKYFFTLPSIQTSRRHAANELFVRERRVAQRFVAASIACISRIMSAKRSNDGMSTIIKIYMDTMVEMDDVLSTKAPGGQVEGRNDSEEGNDDDDNGVNNRTMGQPTVTSSPAVKGKRKRRKGSTMGNFNFVKSNSLGLIAAAEAHEYFGPAVLNWEGGFTGERKIQDVKPFLGIRRSNAKWESIVMTKLYQQETIDWMISRGESETTTGVPSRRDEVGLYVIYKNRTDAVNAIGRCAPLSAVYAKGKVWLVYRPHGYLADNTKVSRSTVNLMQVTFDYTRGKELCGCWMAPITVSGAECSDYAGFKSVSELEKVVKQHLLMLPAVETNGAGRQQNQVTFSNMYYCIGDKWTELNSSGQLIAYTITSEMFSEWESL